MSKVTTGFPALSLLCACLLIPAVAPGEAHAQRVRVLPSKDSVSVGERFTLSVAVKHNGVARPLFADPALGDTLMGDLLVLGRRGPFQSRLAGRSERVDSVVYDVTTFALDSAYVPPQPVRLAVETDTFSVGTPPLAVPVRSVVPEDAADIRDLAPLEEFPRPWWFWALIAAGVLLAGGLVYYFLRRRARKPAAEAEAARPETALEEALRRLAALERVPPPQFDGIKPWYVELADTLRQYIERRLKLPALERTTREITQDLDEARSRFGYPDDLARRVRAVLSAADLVKFADAQPEPAEGRRLVGETRSVLHAIERALTPAVVAPLPADAEANPA